MTYLQGSELQAYLHQRDRERKLRVVLASFLWLMAGLTMLVLLWLA